MNNKQTIEGMFAQRERFNKGFIKEDDLNHLKAEFEKLLDSDYHYLDEFKRYDEWVEFISMIFVSLPLEEGGSVVQPLILNIHNYKADVVDTGDLAPIDVRLGVVGMLIMNMIMFIKHEYALTVKVLGEIDGPYKGNLIVSEALDSIKSKNVNYKVDQLRISEIKFLNVLDNIEIS